MLKHPEDEPLLRSALPALKRYADQHHEEDNPFDAAVLRFAVAIVEHGICDEKDEEQASLKADLAELALHRALTHQAHFSDLQRLDERVDDLEKGHRR